MKLFSSSLLSLKLPTFGTLNSFPQLPLQSSIKSNFSHTQTSHHPHKATIFHTKSLKAMAEEEQGHHHHLHLHHHKEGEEYSGGNVDYEKEKKHHKHFEHLGELRATAASAYALVVNQILF